MCRSGVGERHVGLQDGQGWGIRVKTHIAKKFSTNLNLVLGRITRPKKYILFRALDRWLPTRAIWQKYGEFSRVLKGND